MRLAVRINTVAALLTSLIVGGCSIFRPPDPPGSAIAGTPDIQRTPAPRLEMAGIEGADLIHALRANFRLPLLDNAEVRYYTNWYREHPGAVSGFFENGRWHLPHIVREVLKRRLPAEFALLPAIESGFDSTAASPSGAAGLWQFTEGTARHYGLRQDHWIDERLDPERSTAAALDYLQALGRAFRGDWLLALAAYNAGEGTIRTLAEGNRRRGIPADFRRLALSRETRHFVPKLIALRNVVRDPRGHGMDLPPLENTIRFKRIEVTRAINHRQLAAMCGVDTTVIAQLNAARKRGVAPPGGPYQVVVPNDCTPRVDTAAVPSAHPRHAAGTAADAVYVVARGDSLWTISRRLGVSTGALVDLNPEADGVLMPGQRLRIRID